MTPISLLFISSFSWSLSGQKAVLWGGTFPQISLTLDLSPSYPNFFSSKGPFLASTFSLSPVLAECLFLPSECQLQEVRCGIVAVHFFYLGYWPLEWINRVNKWSRQINNVDFICKAVVEPYDFLQWTSDIQHDAKSWGCVLFISAF